MADSTYNLIEHWKRNAPRPKEQIPFASIMNGLSTPFSAVELKEDTVGRWSFRLRGLQKAAEFSFAGVVAYADDEKTGNLVPDGEEAPASANGRKRQNRANSWCFYTLVLDTSIDGEIYEHMKTMDTYAAENAGWGANRVRRDFMSGKDSRFTTKFWMQCPMFLPVASSMKPAPPSSLHPWVVAADRASYSFRANPRPPVVYGRKDGEPVLIRECEPDHLCTGDVVAVTFTVSYLLTEKEWYPQYQPVEIYVLKHSATGLSVDYDALPANRGPPPTMGTAVVEALVEGSGSFFDDEVRAKSAGSESGYEYDGSSEELGGNIRDEQSGSGEMVEHISAGEEDGGDVVDNTAGSSPVEPITEEASAPPPSQLKGGSDFLRAKSTPSTLSEEADDQTPSEGDVRPPSGSKGAGRKRLLRNSTESEVRENSDDGLDGKRRPRKSARLG